MTSEAQGVKGNVTLNIFDAETNELIATEETHNLVTAVGLERLLEGPTSPSFLGARFHSIRAGFTAATAPAWSDTAVGSGYLIKTLVNISKAVYSTPSGGIDVNCSFEILASEYNGNTINDLSLWLKDVENEEYTLFSRIIRAPIAKTAAIRIEGRWTINFSVVTA